MPPRTLAGTSWPEPGEDGFLKLVVDDDGALIDPARCDSEWSLVRTRNGVCVFTHYVEQGADVLVYAARGDRALSEVHATYAIREPSVTASILAAVEHQRIDDADYGVLDQYGHAAMGPVPVCSHWQPLPQHVDIDSRAVLMLVGGGYLMFAETATCCGMALEPKPHHALDDARSGEGATVWGHPIASNGFSYIVDQPTRLRVGAVWADAFDQAWHLAYWLCPQHRAEIEAAFLIAR